MTKLQKRLVSSYKRYHSTKRHKKSSLSFLRSSMPEIIFRTTRLEGERVTRRMVSFLFK